MDTPGNERRHNRRDFIEKGLKITAGAGIVSIALFTGCKEKK